MSKISGTKEWSVASVNIISGCPHRCRYCYARYNAVKYRQCPSMAAWGTTFHRLRPADVTKRRKLLPGRIMFPTTHDVTPEFLGPCLEVLGRLLEAGNQVLIVSKPHLDCIRAICARFAEFRQTILFRFSIGALDEKILSYWEPGAPTIWHRLESLDFAWREGFDTSVSCEPLLEPEGAADLFYTLQPHVTDTIWIGKLNGIPYRLDPSTDPSEIARIERGQTLGRLREIYEALRHEPKVRWKESYKQALGLPTADEAGLDR